jgi:hypothetical protein
MAQKYKLLWLDKMGEPLYCKGCDKTKLRKEFGSVGAATILSKRFGARVLCKPCEQALAKKYWEEHKQENMWEGRKYRYEMDEKDFDKLLESQNGECAICECELPADKFKSDIDHNHKTGKVRGIVCRSCNITIGMVEKKIKYIDKIIKYIKL